VHGKGREALTPTGVVRVDVLDQRGKHHNEKQHRHAQPNRSVGHELAEPLASDAGVNAPAIKKNTAIAIIVPTTAASLITVSSGSRSGVSSSTHAWMPLQDIVTCPTITPATRSTLSESA
jgi:hypothetical protein